ncbi:MAG: hypothetical protein ACJ71E_07460 [Nitrososphaeraceae archaeon]
MNIDLSNEEIILIKNALEEKYKCIETSILNRLKIRIFIAQVKILKD